MDSLIHNPLFTSSVSSLKANRFGDSHRSAPSSHGLVQNCCKPQQNQTRNTEYDHQQGTEQKLLQRVSVETS